MIDAETNKTFRIPLNKPVINDLKEAMRGYELIVNYFPDSRMAGTARKRMSEIKGKKMKSNRNHLLKVGWR